MNYAYFLVEQVISCCIFLIHYINMFLSFEIPQFELTFCDVIV